MKNLMEKAAAGDRQAVTKLYETYWRRTAAICTASLGETDAAYAAVTQAFQNTWSYLFNHSLKTEEDFAAALYGQAAMLCRRYFVKKGMKGMAVPQGKNFLVTRWNDVCAEGAPPLQRFLGVLPGVNRYLFVLHRIAGFDEKQLASVTGYKADVVKAALTAESQNTARALEQLSRSLGLELDLEKEIQRYQETLRLPEKYKQQLEAEMVNRIRPLEKKRMLRGFLYALGGVCAVVLLGAFAAAYNREEPEIKFSQQQTVSQGDSASAETEGEEEGSLVLETGQTCYADILIDGYGTVTVELSYETAPVTVENFVALAEEGFYDGLTFHRIMEGFMMQGGDPNGDGTGGSGENIVGEFADNGHENTLSHTRGVISMARSTEYNSASSQFFIVQEDSTFLDGQYAAFGWVTEGMEIVDSICAEAEPTDDNGTISPEQQPVITSVTIRTQDVEEAEIKTGEE